MTHDCSTGYHTIPSRSCYVNHGCRCRLCKWHESAYYARRHGKPEPPKPDVCKPGSVKVVVPARAWDTIVAVLGRRGVRPDEWLEAVAERAGRVLL